MMKEKIIRILMDRILDIVAASGANRTEAECSLKAALAILPDLDLQPKASMTIET